MHITTSIRIDGEAIQLAEGQDVEALKARIVDAVTGGARFVDFVGASQVGVSVLVTSRSSVRVEVHEREDEPEDAEEHASGADLDLYSFS
ncbi:hypothetical protein BFL36_07155 [Clavibacter michiganensis]|uniref:Uncharacterized protein n=1 Tax=Clavibacter michiganensis TaxID=28447 RepID=A0A251YHX2_9MICO|nr:hypothetical protein [Clavibacter michiganensis]OUE23817.1 hypothetical protein BFL36_07155 [Clavibacter michiganensis]